MNNSIANIFNILSTCHMWSMHAKYEVSISYGSKVKAKVKVDNRQTDRTNKYAPTIRSGA